MPKSKRNKLVTLSKTQKKGREMKEGLIEQVRGSFGEYRDLYVFEYENMRNSKFKEFKDELKPSSRFFLGSNRVLQVALGKSAADEPRESCHLAAQLLEGQRGIMFTNLGMQEVTRLFNDFESSDFARTGSIATETVELKEGPLKDFAHDMEPFLRKQGMPVRLNKGVVELIGDFTVCTEGEALSPEAARILRLLGMEMAKFKLRFMARWSPDGFHIFPSPESTTPLPPAAADADVDDDAAQGEDSGSAPK
eukprot:TRINITY_DN7913_c0_g5_i1.p1 TRINITY_DN7913_c0_g5~~TRINITY_DN7913_c0_g5_i1.p1  ORF type:complete len:287 (-),score=75.70 TRINITY_DN7913_c0_g5_i1:20-772(-)